LLTLSEGYSIMNQYTPGQDWIAIVRKNGTAEFGKAFAANPTLDASVLNGPCVGVEAIAAFFAATSGGMYETIEFTHETTDGRKTYLEWQGKAFGKHVGGITILTRNNEGLIENIQLYHRPLQVVLEFSRELAKRLEAESRSGFN
jgi:hypothetical protein